MLFFRKKSKPKPPLQEACLHVSKAVEIAYRYKWDEHYMLTSDELQGFNDLVDTVYSAHATIAYLRRCMEQRAAGEPEGSPKWHNRAVFDYHYPP